MHGEDESIDNDKRLKLDEISEHFEIGINSLRYHIKKLKPLFLDVSRDRYNRFLFTSPQVDRLLLVHRLKAQGYPYEKIKEQFNTVGEQILNGLKSQISSEITETSPKLKQNWERQLEQMESHQERLHQINKILIKANKQFDDIITEQNIKINSLEERVALLVDLHTESLLKRGISLTKNFDESLDDNRD